MMQKNVLNTDLTGKEYYEKGDIRSVNTRTFFDLDDSSVHSVFDLNYNGTLIVTQIFAAQMVERAAATSSTSPP